MRQDIIGTAQAAAELNLSQHRVRQLIEEGKISGWKISGRVYAVEAKSLDAVRPPAHTGRPRGPSSK
jgi:excisionase family DNA binding protein